MLSMRSELLVNLLDLDCKYRGIKDPFKKMSYLVKHYSGQVSKCGERVLEHCRQYEQTVRKSASVAQLNRGKAKLLFDKHLTDGPLSNADYADFSSYATEALLNWPLENTSWSSMLSLLELYVYSAQVEFDQAANYSSAISDLTHASSVLKLAPGREAIQADANLLDLLLRMATLKAKLLRCVHNVELDAQLVQELDNKTKNVDSLLNAIESMDRIFEARAIDENDDATLPTNYTVSPKIRLQYSEDGRTYEAVAPISKGEEVLRERTTMTVLFDDQLFNFCFNCYRQIDTFWPCMGCTEVVFCSARCSALAHQNELHHECGIFGLTQKGRFDFYGVYVFRWIARYGIDVMVQCEEQEMKSDTPYDLGPYLASDAIRTKHFRELTPAERQLQCRALTSLLTHRGDHSSRHEVNASALAISVLYALIYKGVLPKKIVTNAESLSYILEIIATSLMRLMTNDFRWRLNEDGKSVGNCHYYLASLFNHGCNPNVKWTITDGGVVHMTAVRDIEPGEPLFISYSMSTISFGWRQNRLFLNYCFYCDCEDCLLKAAKSFNSLRCRTGKCPGPVMMIINSHVCLKCGHSTPEGYIYLFKAKVHSLAFKRAYGSVRGKSFVQRIPLLNLMLPGRKAKKVLNFHDEPTNQKAIKLEGIRQVEYHFHAYAALIYGGSYQFLNMCNQLLKLYTEAGLYERGLRIFEYFDQSLATIFPKTVHSSLVKLLYMLDYAANFYHYLATECEFNITELSDHLKEDRNLKPPNLLANDWYQDFCVRLNTKLAHILENDLVKHGNFFPKLWASLPTSEESLSKSPEEQMQDAINGSIKDGTVLGYDELYFRQMYIQCRARLASIEAIANQA